MIPTDFQISRKAPPQRELEWIHQKVKELQPKKILEFGCGATTYAINTACAPEIHVAIETYQPSIDQVRKHVPTIQIIKSWAEIPSNEYDFIFIDSSVGNPHNRATCRDKAIEAVEHLTSSKTHIMMHDYFSRYGRASRKYLEDHPYQLIDTMCYKMGLALFVKQ